MNWQIIKMVKDLLVRLLEDEIKREKICVSNVAFHICKKHPEDCEFVLTEKSVFKIFSKFHNFVERKNIPFFIGKRIEEIIIALVLWNAKKVDASKTLDIIRKELEPEFLQYWKAYDEGILEWSEKIGFVKKAHKKNLNSLIVRRTIIVISNCSLCSQPQNY